MKLVLQVGTLMLGYSALFGLVLLIAHLVGVNLPKAMINFANVIFTQLGL